MITEKEFQTIQTGDFIAERNNLRGWWKIWKVTMLNYSELTITLTEASNGATDNIGVMYNYELPTLNMILVSKETKSSMEIDHALLKSEKEKLIYLMKA